MVSVSTSVITTRALVELNAADAGGSVQPELAALALDTLNQVLDDWNAQSQKIYANSFLDFTIIPNQNPTTIGAAGADWVMTQAPQDINGIQVQLTGTPVPYVFVKKRNAAWWQTQPSPTTTATFPTDFYYDPTWTTAAPYGSVYLWPVPTQPYDVQVWTRIILGQLTANQTISLPPGYNRALMLMLAKALAGPLRKPWTAQQDEQLKLSLTQIDTNNTKPPNVRTQDSGMPRAGSQGLPDFFWPDGSIRSR